MAVEGKTWQVLWSAFLCLLVLVLYVNFAGPMWDKLDVALSLSSSQQRQNSSDAVHGLGQWDRLVISEESSSSVKSKFPMLQQNGREQNKTCTGPVTNFVFIKVHKTASDSTAVVLLRFAYNHHMVMCYPRTFRGRHSLTLTYPSTEIYKANCSRWNVLGDHYNFIVHHTVFNKTAMDRVMVPGTKYIGILREPQSHSRSVFFYHNHYRIFVKQEHTNPLGEFLDTPEYYETLVRDRRALRERNFQAFVMGFPPHLLRTQDTEVMDKAIRQLNESYTFVIITEYYEESLVMLRRKFCWDMYDILHSAKKIHEQHDPRKSIPLTHAQLQNHHRINAIDYRMYDFFNMTFWENVRDETGRGFWEEVAYFKELLERVNTYCSTEQNESPLAVPASKWHEPFFVNRTLCEGLGRPPRNWAEKFFDQITHRDRVWEKLNVPEK